jgi:SAM-dependent methyltransferase
MGDGGPRFADDVERHPIVGAAHRLLLGQLPSGVRRVVEVGSGPGRVLEILRRRGVPRVVGIDLVPHPKVWAGVTDAPALVRADLARLPLRAAWFDAAVCVFINRPVWRRPATLRELARVVRPGGRVIFSVVNVLNPLVLARQLSYRCAWPGGADWRIPAPREVERRLVACGLRIRRRLGVSYPPYGRTRGAAGWAAAWYYRLVGSRAATAPILGIVAERR